jgi:hypothetical protein
MLTATQLDTGKNVWMIFCLLTSYSDEYHHHGHCCWLEYLLFSASNWIAYVVIALQDLYLKSSEREWTPPKFCGVIFHCNSCHALTLW